MLECKCQTGLDVLTFLFLKKENSMDLEILSQYPPSPFHASFAYSKIQTYNPPSAA